MPTLTTVDVSPGSVQSTLPPHEKRAERAFVLVHRLVGTQPEYEVYGNLIHQLLQMSEALDVAAERTRLPALRGLRARRSSHRLRAELQSCGFTEPLMPRLEETRRIVDRIHTLAVEEPLLLLAHDYARALRDPNALGPTGLLAQHILVPGHRAQMVDYQAEPFEPFFESVARMDLVQSLKRRLLDEAIRAQGMNLRFVRDFHQHRASV